VDRARRPPSVRRDRAGALAASSPTPLQKFADAHAGVSEHRIRLLLKCPDRAGIVAAISRFLYEAGANIVESAQYSTAGGAGIFFMRLQFDLGSRSLVSLEEDFQHAVAGNFGMDWSMWPAAQPKRVALLCSRYEHCVLDLLWRWRGGELHADIPMVISNHADLRNEVALFGVPFHHVPVPSPAAKPAAERAMLELLRGQVDLVVLARYMQIVTAEFLAEIGAPVINIHHSFLPAFPGANPYARAHERGVKLIGATAHYVTAELDAGPIIEQDIQRVTHREDAVALERIGRDVERVALARAVALHLDDSVLVYGNRTLVF
jgi:formyltetrahydrofolate deformylase